MFEEPRRRGGVDGEEKSLILIREDEATVDGLCTTCGKEKCTKSKVEKQSVKETTDSKCEELWFISVACLFPMFVLAPFWFQFLAEFWGE